MLLIAAPPERCGWLWAHTLLAEQTYTRTLREQLLAWGWRPQSLTMTDDELAVLARQGLQQDPMECCSRRLTARKIGRLLCFGIRTNPNRLAGRSSSTLPTSLTWRHGVRGGGLSRAHGTAA